jgi:hypothetical protein
MMLQRRWVGYAWTAGATVVCTLAGLALHPRFDLVNVAMVCLLAVALIISRFVESIRSQAAAKGRSEIEAGTEWIRSRLLGSVSHVLRTLLAVIAGAPPLVALERIVRFESQA